MASIVSAGTTSGTSLNLSADTSGVLQLATNGTTTAVTIDTSQNVGIGTANPSRKLTVSNPSATSTTLLANILTRLESNGSGADCSLQFSDIVTNSAGISMNQGNLVTTIAGGEVMRVNTSGTVRFISAIGVGNATPTTSGAGITFPATQSASSDANTLDDYEEGTWTPQIGGSSTGMASVTYVTQNGKYTKIGDTVFITMQLQWSAASGGSGDARVYGLPFACPDSYTAFAASQFINLGVGTDFQMRSDANTRLAPQTSSGASGLGLSSYTSGSFNKYIAVSGCYKV